MQLWVVDPKTKEASVSLSMLMLTFVGSLVAATLHMADKVGDTSIMTELFMTTAGLYFGRRFQFKSGSSVEAKENGSGD